MKIVCAGALEYYVHLVHSDSLQEQVLSASGLWILAFHDENKLKISQQEGCMTGEC